MKIFSLIALCVTASLVSRAAGPTETNSATAKTAPSKSIFSMPKKFSEGRDPFYPESTRVFQQVMAENSSHTVEISSLTVQGYSRDSQNAYVIINNRTFGIGDERDVITPGGRVHLKCIEVLPETVVIEYNGSLHQIPLAKKK